MSATYTSFAGSIVKENRGGAVRRYVADTLGSTAKLTDTSGTVTDSFEYWPYGEERTRTGTTATPFTFVGTLGYYKDAAGRLYVRARTLMAKYARWLTVDPLWPDEQAYGYVGQRPAGLVDPSGLWNPACVAAGICAGAALGAILACLGSPLGVRGCILCWAQSHPLLASLIFGVCAASIIMCVPSLAPALRPVPPILRPIGALGGAALPVGAFAAGGGSGASACDDCEGASGRCLANCGAQYGLFLYLSSQPGQPWSDVNMLPCINRGYGCCNEWCGYAAANCRAGLPPQATFACAPFAQPPFA